MEKISLRYSDERDKTYGITGMVITLVACDGEDMLAEIHLDAEPGETLVMNPRYGFKGNPRMSAKIVWAQTLKDLRLTASMALGNIACRRHVLAGRMLSDADTSDIRTALRNDAREHCALEPDEADALFDSCLSYVERIFRHQGIHGVAHTFSDRLASRRSMTASEAIELLASLGLQ